MNNKHDPIDFIRFALCHAKHETIPRGATLPCSREDCGVDPWECLRGVHYSKACMASESFLRSRYDLDYEPIGWSWEVYIYTDGACSGNPGPGGWAAILLCSGKSREIRGYEPVTTNNRMELMAAIQGLQALTRPCDVHLFTDSAYLCNAINQKWLDKWQRNGWVNSNKQQVSNRDLWNLVLELSSIHKITWHKVKGHADNQLNNRCDELARLSIQDQSTVL